MPSDLDSKRVYKVALIGVTGCGKSSIVNLLADSEEPVADVSRGVEACTRRAQWFPVSIEEKAFRLWDTMGFNQAEARDINPLSPYEQAHALLRNLQSGVDLILLCARKDGINASLRNLYWLLNTFFFGGQAPIALVLTHFDVPDKGWWDRNVRLITERCNIPAESLPHVCITTVQDESPTHKESKQALQALLQERAVSPTPLPLDLSSDTAIADAVESLKNHCQLTLLDAQTLVEHFRSPRRPFRAILFGEAGVGKSSIINLILGEPKATVSSKLDSCTMSFCRYDINTGSHQFLVWDTVGFNGRYQGKDATVVALSNAASLVRELHGKGGIDLLVFCKREGRLSQQELQSFRLFQEFLCEGQIPVAFIITHLDTFKEMKTWWKENGENLVKECSLRKSALAGHACITAAQDDPEDVGLKHKLSFSRQLVAAMFEDSISFGNAFNRDEDVWVMSFLKRVVVMVKGSQGKKEKINSKKLAERCGLSRQQADELVKLLQS